jgi:hypothetical protein
MRADERRNAGVAIKMTKRIGHKPKRCRSSVASVGDARLFSVSGTKSSKHVRDFPQFPATNTLWN